MNKQKALRKKKNQTAKYNRDNEKDIDLIIEEINKIKIERSNLNRTLKNNILIKINESKKIKCAHLLKRECINCNKKHMCNNCNICGNCKKNLSYYKGFDDEAIKKYSKIRIRVEHFFSHLKNGRLQNIKDKDTKMLRDTIFNGITNAIFYKTGLRLQKNKEYG